MQRPSCEYRFCQRFRTAQFGSTLATNPHDSGNRDAGDQMAHMMDRYPAVRDGHSSALAIHVAPYVTD